MIEIKYDVIVFYKDGSRKILATGLSLQSAKQNQWWFNVGSDQDTATIVEAEQQEEQQ